MTLCNECDTAQQVEPSATDRFVDCVKCQSPVWVPAIHTRSRPAPASKDPWLSLVCVFGVAISLLLFIAPWQSETSTASAVYFGTLMMLVTGAYIRKQLRSLSQQLDHIAKQQSESASETQQP